METIGSLISKPKGRGGVRPNSGRKKGTMEPHVIERMAAEKEMKQRILRHITPILNAQLNVAKGQTFMYRIEEVEEGKQIKRKHILVTDPDEIRKVLDECDGDGEFDGDYYYMTTKSPDTRAIDSLMDRVFGKAKQSVEISGDEEKPLVVRQLETELKDWANKK